MEATIALLEGQGLAQTTTVRIQELAGVSRGRLLHHFPSREGLLIAAVRHLAIARFEALRGKPAPLHGKARIRAAVEALWSTYDGPLFWAATELWVGARTNKSLREALLPEERRLGWVVRDLCDEMFGEELCAHAAYPTIRELLLTSMRGVAMTYLFDQRPISTDPHRELWYRWAAAALADGEEVEEEGAEEEGAEVGSSS